MKFKSLVLAGVMVLAGVLSFVGLQQRVSAVSCPTGSLHAGQDKPSLAECNLPDQKEGDPELIDTVITIINVIVGVIGLVAIVVIVVGGIYYVTSMGDASKTVKGKNAILYGLVGLVISLLAFAVVNFVLNAVFGRK